MLSVVDDIDEVLFVLVIQQYHIIVMEVIDEVDEGLWEVHTKDVVVEYIHDVELVIVEGLGTAEAVLLSLADDEVVVEHERIEFILDIFVQEDDDIDEFEFVQHSLVLQNILHDEGIEDDTAAITENIQEVVGQLLCPIEVVIELGRLVIFDEMQLAMVDDEEVAHMPVLHVHIGVDMEINE